MKTKYLPKTILLAVLLSLSTLSHAAFLGGTRLIQHLEEDMRGEATHNVGFTTGYIVGVADTINGTLVCLPPSVTVKQLKQIVYNYMKSSPEQWNQAADEIVTSALRSAWPCKR